MIDVITRLKQIGELEAEISTIRGNRQTTEELLAVATDKDEILEMTSEIELYTELIDERETKIGALLPDGYMEEGEHTEIDFKSGREVANHVQRSVDKVRGRWYDNDDLLPKYERIAYDKALKSAREACKLDIIGGAVGVDVSHDEVESIVARSTTPDALVANVERMCVVKQQEKFKDILGDLDGDTVEKTIVECNVPESKLRDAFVSMEKLSAIHRGAGKAFIEKYLRSIFGNSFTDADYDTLSGYDDADMLIDSIRSTCGKRNVLDIATIEYVVDRIDDEDLSNRSEINTVLNANLGRHDFAKVVSNSIRDADDVIHSNRKSVLDVLATTNRLEYAKISKSLLGISDDEYSTMWKRKREDITRGTRKGSMTTGEYNKHIDDLVREAKINEMHRLAGDTINGYDDGIFLDKNMLKRQIYTDFDMSNNLLFTSVYGVADVKTVRNNSRRRLEAGLVKMFKDRGIMQDNLFMDEVLRKRVDERNMQEYGDPDYATRRLNDIVHDVFGYVSVDTGDIVTKCDKNIGDGMDTIPSLVSRYDSAIDDIKRMADEQVRDVKLSEIERLTWEGKVPGAKEKVDKEIPLVTRARIKEYEPGYMMPGTYKRERMHEAYEAARVKPYHEVEDLVETIGFGLRELPKDMRRRGRFRVIGDDKHMDFKTLAGIKKWFNEYYKEA